MINRLATLGIDESAKKKETFKKKMTLKLEEDPNGEDRLDHNIILFSEMYLFRSLTNYCCLQHVGLQGALFPLQGCGPVAGSCQLSLQLSLTKVRFCLLGGTTGKSTLECGSDANLDNLVYNESLLSLSLQLTGDPVFLALGLLMQIGPSYSQHPGIIYQAWC